MKKLKFLTGEFDLGTFEELYNQFFSTYEEKFDKTPSAIRSNFLKNLIRILEKERRELADLQAKYDRQIRAMNNSDSIDELVDIHSKLNFITGDIFLKTRSVTELHARCTNYRDKLTLKLISITKKQMNSKLDPAKSSFAWIRMGSTGRDEQTLVTDQDNLLVYKNKDDKNYYREFAERMVDNLEKLGFTRCKGNIMPTNDKWFGTLSEWRGKLHSYIADSENLVDLIVLTDVKYAGGNYPLGRAFIKETRTALKTYYSSFKAIAKATVLMPIALTIFRNFKTEKKGEYKDMLNIKNQGWLPLIMITLLFSLENDIPETNTVKRIKLLEELNLFEPQFAENLMESYFILTTYKIFLQLDYLHGRTDSLNYFINPYKLDKAQQEKLKWSLSIVDKFQRLASSSYNISEDAL